MSGAVILLIKTKMWWLYCVWKVRKMAWKMAPADLQNSKNSFLSVNFKLSYFCEFCFKFFDSKCVWVLKPTNFQKYNWPRANVRVDASKMPFRCHFWAQKTLFYISSIFKAIFGQHVLTKGQQKLIFWKIHATYISFALWIENFEAKLAEISQFEIHVKSIKFVVLNLNYRPYLKKKKTDQNFFK